MDSGIQVAVNGSADDGDNDVGRAQTVRVGGGLKSFSQDLLQDGLRTILAERHNTGVNGLNFRGINIQQRDRQTTAGQHDA